MDKKSSATLAKLARQAGNMYSEVSSLFNAPSLVTHFERSWVAHTQMKVRWFAGLAPGCLRVAAVKEANQPSDSGVNVLMWSGGGNSAHPAVVLCCVPHVSCRLPCTMCWRLWSRARHTTQIPRLHWRWPHSR